jgi:hypothetical protein
MKNRLPQTLLLLGTGASRYLPPILLQTLQHTPSDHRHLYPITKPQIQYILDSEISIIQHTDRAGDSVDQIVITRPTDGIL